MTSIGRTCNWLLQQREVSLGLLISMVIFAVGLVDVGFLSLGNWNDIFARSAPTAIVACGVMLVVLTGEIDISVGSLMAILAASMGLMISEHHWNLATWIGIPVTLLMGAAMGAATGLFVTVGQVPSIIVTLGLLTSLRGLTIWTMGGSNIDGLPIGLTSLAKQGILGIPLSVWTACVVVLTTAVLLTQTPVGRRIYALGSSKKSARLAGLSERRLKLFAFSYTGFLTALATVVDVPRLPKIESGIGSDFELLVVTCVVVGGVSISGGKGRITGVILAVILMTMIRPVLTFLDIGESGEKWTKAIQGLFIVLAIISDSLMTRRSKRESST